MHGKNMRACVYDECKLPENNNRYWLQLICLVLSLFCMLINIKSFSFLSIFIYTVPITIDIFYADYQIKWLNVLRTLFLVLNITIVIFCAIGLFGFFVDDGSSISIVETSVVYAGWGFNKNKLVAPLVLDLLVPVSMIFGCPNKKTAHAIQFCANKRGQ